jgi:hypothetical protein
MASNKRRLSPSPSLIRFQVAIAESRRQSCACDTAIKPHSLNLNQPLGLELFFFTSTLRKRLDPGASAPQTRWSLPPSIRTNPNLVFRVAYQLDDTHRLGEPIIGGIGVRSLPPCFRHSAGLPFSSSSCSQGSALQTMWEGRIASKSPGAPQKAGAFPCWVSRPPPFS